MTFENEWPKLGEFSEKFSFPPTLETLDKTEPDIEEEKANILFY